MNWQLQPICRVLLLQYVHGNLEDPKTVTHHKLLHAATERVLADTKTVADENLKDKGRFQATAYVLARVLRGLSRPWPVFVRVADVLLLMKKRPPPAPPKMAEVSADEKVSFASSLPPSSFRTGKPGIVFQPITFSFPGCRRKSKTTRPQTKTPS